MCGKHELSLRSFGLLCISLLGLCLQGHPLTFLVLTEILRRKLYRLLAIMNENRPKIRIFDTNLKSVQLHASGTWCVSVDNTRRLQDFTDRCLRYINCACWPHKSQLDLQRGNPSSMPSKADSQKFWNESGVRSATLYVRSGTKSISKR